MKLFGFALYQYTDTDIGIEYVQDIYKERILLTADSGKARRYFLIRALLLAHKYKLRFTSKLDYK
ncbi:MAG: hypothetical protein ACHQET_02885 [Chitinophagales bacterium]